jgi:hypothetical protein
MSGEEYMIALGLRLRRRDFNLLFYGAVALVILLLAADAYSAIITP